MHQRVRCTATKSGKGSEGKREGTSAEADVVRSSTRVALTCGSHIPSISILSVSKRWGKAAEGVLRAIRPAFRNVDQREPAKGAMVRKWRGSVWDGSELDLNVRLSNVSMDGEAV